MGTVIGWIAVPLGYVMEWCYSIFNNYGLAIIFFTFLTRLVQLPLGIWIQFNSIKMVKIQPAVNWIKVKFFGDNETIAEEQSKMFKKEKYNPFLTLIPLAIQIIILLGVIAVIYKPFTNLLHLDAGVIAQMESIASSIHNLPSDSSSLQLLAVQDIQGSMTSAYSVIDPAIIAKIQSLDLTLFGIDLTLIPSELIAKTFLAVIAPLIAGFSAWLLCFCQNKSNVLQSEQGKLNKYGLMGLSVALSLYLGFFVPMGIALYWTSSNLIAIIQLYVLNAVIPPKKYVDYEELEKSRAALAELNAMKEKNKISKEDKQREKADYKRFFSIANKHLVFYSEKSGFYKYYEHLLNYLIDNSNITIHYITNDPNDQIFEIAKTQTQIKPYYIGMNKLITMFMKMEADIVVMTSPDLDNCHIKRSLMRKDIEYIYVPHDPMGSMSIAFREHAFDNFDTCFCNGPTIVPEYRATEKLYGTKEKTLVEFGYPFIEKLCEEKAKMVDHKNEKTQILIAPSWQEDNILESCIDTIVDQLYRDDYLLIIRPHPEFVKRFPEKMDRVVERYKDKEGPNLKFELDFTSNESVYTSDVLITDWSGISIEVALSTLRPVLFINTTLKCNNPNYAKIGIEPQNFVLRDKLGVSLDMDELDKVSSTIDSFLKDTTYKDKLKKIRETHFFHFGSKGKYGGEYILDRLTKK